jgi:hypothetical protein
MLDVLRESSILVSVYFIFALPSCGRESFSKFNHVIDTPTRPRNGAGNRVMVYEILRLTADEFARPARAAESRKPARNVRFRVR